MYDLIASNYSSIFPLEAATVRFIEYYLKTINAKKILDIGCATGDLALALCQRGYFMSGIDLNKKMIDIAKAKAGKHNASVSFKTQNMLELDANEKFDCVLCLGNTLPHVSSWTELEKCITIINRLLNKNGIFIFQILNYDKIVRDASVQFPKKENGEYVFSRNYTNITEDKITFEIDFFDKIRGTHHTDSTELLPVKRTRVLELLQADGFIDSQVFSDYEKNTAGRDDFYNVFVSRKR